jgi:ABC-2 type transport system ATP-binding protein
MAETMMIEAEALTKRYGQTQALAGVSLQVPAGSILGILGPNGAGKTTAVRILTTLAVPNSGHARIAGHDVVKEAAAVRRTIGVTAQDATLDDLLTGRQNLVMVGELSGLHRGDAKRRAVDLLARFQLTDAADRVLKGYSLPAWLCALRSSSSMSPRRDSTPPVASRCGRSSATSSATARPCS